ncbi:putative callose synthase 8, partial [Clarias magur]
RKQNCRLALWEKGKPQQNYCSSFCLPASVSCSSCSSYLFWRCSSRRLHFPLPDRSTVLNSSLK